MGCGKRNKDNDNKLLCMQKKTTKEKTNEWVT